MLGDLGLTAKEYSTLTPPDLTCSEAQKTELWHRNAIRYFSSFYNTRRRSFGSKEITYYKTPVEQIYDSFAYIMGRQQSGDYAFFTQDFNGLTQDELGIVAGKKTASLVDFMRGQAERMIANMRIETTSISPNAKTKETEMVEKLLFMVNMKGELDRIEEQDGLSFSPAGDREFNMKEDAFRFIEKDFKELMQEGTDIIAKGILYDNDYKQLFLRCFTHAVAAARCGIEVIVRNGQVIFEHIPAWYAIVDTSKDDDFNKKKRFAGYINYLTPSEVFSRYKCTSDEKELIKNLSNRQPVLDGIGIDLLNNCTNYTWWNFYGNSQPIIAVVKMYWKCRQDLNYKQKVDQYGNLKMVKTNYTVKKSEFETEGWQQGTLIGNIVLKDYGPTPNRIGLFEKYVKDDCPIKYFLPNMNVGETSSVVDKLKSHQDRLDAIDRKIIDLVASDLGNVATFNGAATGNVHVEKILADWKVNKVTVINGSTGEQYDDNQLKSLLMSNKIGGSEYIAEYSALKEQEKRDMEEIINLPRIALGQQQTYTGMGVQQQTIQQGELGTATLYNGIVDWYCDVVQYATNIAKYVYTIDDDFSARVQVGDREFKYLKLTRDIRMEEIGVRFVVKDIIDAQAKQRLMGWVQAGVQSGVLDVLDALMIESESSLLEMRNNLEYSLKKKERKAEQQRGQEMLLQQIQHEQNLALQAEQAKLQSQTSKETTDTKVNAGLVETAMKADPSLVQQI